MDSLIALLGDTEDGAIVKSASLERPARVAGSGTRDSMQSGESRAWGRSGNVD